MCVCLCLSPYSFSVHNACLLPKVTVVGLHVACLKLYTKSTYDKDSRENRVFFFFSAIKSKLMHTTASQIVREQKYLSYPSINFMAETEAQPVKYKNPKLHN